MFYLYLKTHNITGLKYLGFTKNDPFKYTGSGVYWKRHIKQYGYDVSTEILFQSSDIDELSKAGQHYSVLWNVADDEGFANLCEEDGNKNFGRANINFRGHPQTPETREKISKNNGLGLKGKFGIDHPRYGKPRPDNIDRMHFMWDARRGVPSWNSGKTGLQQHSEETKLKMSLAKKGMIQPTMTCPHCNKIGKSNAMKRWHFDNCRNK